MRVSNVRRERVYMSVNDLVIAAVPKSVYVSLYSGVRPEHTVDL